MGLILDEVQFTIDPGHYDLEVENRINEVGFEYFDLLLDLTGDDYHGRKTQGTLLAQGYRTLPVRTETVVEAARTEGRVRSQRQVKRAKTDRVSPSMQPNHPWRVVGCQLIERSCRHKDGVVHRLASVEMSRTTRSVNITVIVSAIR